MKAMRSKQSKLASYIDSLQAQGSYTFLRDDAISELKVSENAYKLTAWRLMKKGRIVSPRRGFFVIIPLEYQSAGAPPPSWYIEDLMKFYGKPYYVGLLTAAAIHGAAHQRPQEFQIVTSSPDPSIIVGRSRICFFTKRRIEQVPTMKVKTETGFMRVATPEATAFDLLRYVSSAGHLNNVATVLTELLEKLDGKSLVEAAKADIEVSVAQRLGFLLDHLGGKKITGPLVKWVSEKTPRPVLLKPGYRQKGARIDSKWHVIVNEKIEVDE